MRRLVAVTLAVLASLALIVPPAAADRDVGHGRPPIARTGSFAGSGTYDLTGLVCTFAHEVINGTYDTSPRPGNDGTFVLDYCAGLEDLGTTGAFTLTGTFTVETTSGITLSGSVAGTLQAGLPNAAALTLTVTESSGSRRPITGTITMAGTRTEPGGLFTAEITGTFTTDLRC